MESIEGSYKGSYKIQPKATLTKQSDDSQIKILVLIVFFPILCSKNDFGLLLALGAAQNSLLDSSRSFFL